MTERLAKFIFNRMPFSFPSSKPKYYFSIIACILEKDATNLSKVLKSLRITIRRNGAPYIVFKRSWL